MVSTHIDRQTVGRGRTGISSSIRIYHQTQVSITKDIMSFITNKPYSLITAIITSSHTVSHLLIPRSHAVQC
ncbi:hypothetical protein UPYG_G00117510 [Umbra pygmaea]|uniref:Uncharacterized protein n=1 Tax=Umbra pygmaea TaxID=75934 RepID=A0ABD0X467_UMBPY